MLSLSLCLPEASQIGPSAQNVGRSISSLKRALPVKVKKEGKGRNEN